MWDVPIDGLYSSATNILAGDYIRAMTKLNEANYFFDNCNINKTYLCSSAMNSIGEAKYDSKKERLAEKKFLREYIDNLSQGEREKIKIERYRIKKRNRIVKIKSVIAACLSIRIYTRMILILRPKRENRFFVNNILEL